MFLKREDNSSVTRFACATFPTREGKAAAPRPCHCEPARTLVWQSPGCLDCPKGMHAVFTPQGTFASLQGAVAPELHLILIIVYLLCPLYNSDIFPHFLHFLWKVSVKRQIFFLSPQDLSTGLLQPVDSFLSFSQDMRLFFPLSQFLFASKCIICVRNFFFSQHFTGFPQKLSTTVETVVDNLTILILF